MSRELAEMLVDLQNIGRLEKLLGRALPYLEMGHRQFCATTPDKLGELIADIAAVLPARIDLVREES